MPSVCQYSAADERHRLVVAVNRTDLYLLEVEWRSLAAHTDHFEPRIADAEFMDKLEPFLVDEPVVLHVPTAKRRATLEDQEALG
jgi:hypothetical protein